MTSFLKCLHEAEYIMSVFYIGIRTQGSKVGVCFQGDFHEVPHTILCTLLSRALSYALIYLKERLRNWVLIMINHGFITNRVITEFTEELAYIDVEIGYYKELSWNNIFNPTWFRQTGIYAHLSYKVEKKECSGWNLLNTECSPRIIWRENVKKWDMIHNSETLIELSLKCWLNS